MRHNALLRSEEWTLEELDVFVVVNAAMMTEWFQHVTKMGFKLSNREDMPLDTCGVIPRAERRRSRQSGKETGAKCRSTVLHELRGAEEKRTQHVEARVRQASSVVGKWADEELAVAGEGKVGEMGSLVGWSGPNVVLVEAVAVVDVVDSGRNELWW